MANKTLPIGLRKIGIKITKKKPYIPQYSEDVYKQFEDYPGWDNKSNQEKDRIIATIGEGTRPDPPPHEFPPGGINIAKGGLIKKKQMRHGGVPTKRPQMMHGGAYKGKSHSYATGGAVKDMKSMRNK